MVKTMLKIVLLTTLLSFLGASCADDSKPREWAVGEIEFANSGKGATGLVMEQRPGNQGQTPGSSDAPDPVFKSVGTLLIGRQQVEGMCSGFAAIHKGEHVLVTNAHCLHKTQRQYGRSCKNLKFFILNEGKVDSFACEHVIDASEANEFKNGLDYALLKMEKKFAGLPALPWGKHVSNEVSVPASFPMGKNRDGRIVTNLQRPKCKHTMGGFPNYDTEDTALELTFYNCFMVPGTSGAPILNDKDEVIGINRSGGEGKRDGFNTDGKLKRLDFGQGTYAPRICGHENPGCRNTNQKLIRAQEQGESAAMRQEALRKSLIHAHGDMLTQFQNWATNGAFTDFYVFSPRLEGTAQLIGSLIGNDPHQGWVVPKVPLKVQEEIPTNAGKYKVATVPVMYVEFKFDEHLRENAVETKNAFDSATPYFESQLKVSPPRVLGGREAILSLGRSGFQVYDDFEATWAP